MSTVSITRLYDLLSAKVGRGTAENLTSFIEEKIKGEFADKTDVLATKEYVSTTIANSKADLIKWMFVFWVSQLISTFGFILLFLKK